MEWGGEKEMEWKGRERLGEDRRAKAQDVRRWTGCWESKIEVIRMEEGSGEVREKEGGRFKRREEKERVGRRVK